MKWEHFKTFLWLRWRLLVNQLKRAGTLSLVISVILLVLALISSAGFFVLALVVGIFLLPEASPLALLLVWDGLVLPFLFFWLIGLLADLQRSELLALDNFWHLPVSLSSVFLINYFGSLVALSIIVFVPAMLGLSLALIAAKGPQMALLIPLMLSFLLAVTALTHQFRGWLAALMENKRRRRTIVVVATMSIILVLQLPNLLNVFQPWNRSAANDTAWQQEKKQADAELAAKRIDGKEHVRLVTEILKKHNDAIAEESRNTRQKVETWAALANLVLPPGWLPYGAMTLAQGNVTPALLATAVLATVGAASLRRSYRTTMRLYTGQFTARPAATAQARPPVSAPLPKPSPASVALLEKKLPWVSEQASAIALACFRSLTRAPEAKMILLTPLMMAVIFGSMMLTKSMDPVEYLRPLIGTGAMAMVLMSMVQIAGNQFGFDRSGFRTFVLCAVPRRDILLGKNLSLAPLVLALGAVMLAIVQVVYPMRLDHFVATWPQLISMYLIFSLMANCLSIMAPMPIAAGTLKAKNPKGTVFMLHLLFTFLFPITLSVTLLPLATEALVNELWGAQGVPICLILSLVELALVGVLYHFALHWLGAFLQAREQRILEIVTVKME